MPKEFGTERYVWGGTAAEVNAPHYKKEECNLGGSTKVTTICGLEITRPDNDPEFSFLEGTHEMVKKLDLEICSDCFLKYMKPYLTSKNHRASM